MRKREPLAPKRVRSLLSAGRQLPEMEPADELAVEAASGRVRRRVRR